MLPFECCVMQEETTSEYGTEDGSVSDVMSQQSPRLYEDILSDAIIKKVRKHNNTNRKRSYHLEGKEL